jgi:hypothetical protein
MPHQGNTHMNLWWSLYTVALFPLTEGQMQPEDPFSKQLKTYHFLYLVEWFTAAVFLNN